MRKYMKMELRRAFGGASFWGMLCIACGICVWHFVANVLPLRDYIYMEKSSYPLSIYGVKGWLGMDLTSVQQGLYYMIIPILCAVPYGRSFYFDMSSGFASQLTTRGEKRGYLAAKFTVAFLSGAAISGIPLVFDFLLTGTVLPCVIPQSGTGSFAVWTDCPMGGLLIRHPLAYTLVFLLIDIVFFGLFNTVSIWAVGFLNNGFWVSLTPFLSYLLLFCIMRYADEPRFAPFLFLMPGQSHRSDWGVVIFEFCALVLLDVFFFLWDERREWFNYE